MRIGGPASGSGIQSRSNSKTGRKSDTTFSPASGEEHARTGPSGGVGSVYGVDALLALQEVDDALGGKRKAMRRGHELLDTLEQMRIDLLAGDVPAERLTRIVSLVQSRPSSGDPQLEALVDEIDLRARVELAKLGHFLDR